uniref:Uncharacterized protein n=1 Tax=Romanomermis culicivorax TaxID=13658 RepID=A0A915K2H0_ROMCU
MIKSYSKFISRLALKNLGKNSVRYSVHCTEWNRERLEQLWMRRQILGPDPPTPRALKPNW